MMFLFTNKSSIITTIYKNKNATKGDLLIMITYSIHTFQLQTRISTEGFLRLRTVFHSLQLSVETRKKSSRKYPNCLNHIFTYRRFPFYGINSITLLINQRIPKSDNPIVKYYPYININPYNALYQCKNSGADIIVPEDIKASIDIIQHNLNQFLLPETIKMLTLNRLDFCMNLIFTHQSHADEYMKLLKKGIPQKTLTEKKYFNPVQRRLTSYKDALLLECKSYSFEIYSKYRQMLARKMQNPDSASGMIRLELRASKTKILQLAKKYNLFFTSQNYIAFLPKTPEISRQEIPRIISKMVGTQCFYTYQYISDKIENADFKSSDKELMLQIINYFLKHTVKQNLLNDLNLSNQKWNKILKKFNKLGCSPIPVPLSFKIHTYPGVAVWDASF